jgi:DNA replication ATP-dependent helicase Dna2
LTDPEQDLKQRSGDIPVDDKGGKTDVRGKIVRVAADPQISKQGGYEFRGLEIETGADDGRTFIIIPSSISRAGRDDLYELPLLCRIGAEIAAYDLWLNSLLSDGSVVLTVSPESALVIEPKRPVNVTAAAEAAVCLRSYDIRSRTGIDEVYHLAKGRLIHSFLEPLLPNRENPDGSDFEAIFFRALPAFLEAMLGARKNESLHDLRLEAGRHFSHIRRFTESSPQSELEWQTEIDRVSLRWGLRGRADAVGRSELGDTILELKTGRHEADEHLLQLAAYVLLFTNEETGNVPDGTVFYSSHSRNRRLENTLKWEVIRGRNRVIALEHVHACNRTGLDDWYAEYDCPLEDRRCFSRSTCRKLFSTFQNPTPDLGDVSKNEYYNDWWHTISSDVWTQQTIFSELFKAGTLDRRLRDGTTTEVETGESTLSSPSHRRSSDENRRTIGLIIKGEPGSLSPGDEVILHHGDSGASTVQRGRLIAVDGNRASLAIAGSQSFCHVQGRLFLDRVPFVRPRELSRISLHTFLTRAKPTVIEAVVSSYTDFRCGSPALQNETSHRDSKTEVSTPATDGHFPLSAREGLDTMCSPSELSFSEGMNCELNPDQEQAVVRAMASDPFHLIHGPPGTGKTRVLARLIRRCADSGERVLVACPTNTALDRLLTALVQLGMTDLLRVGAPSNASSDLTRIIEQRTARPLLLKDLARLDFDPAGLKRYVDDIPVVGTTLYQCASHPMFLQNRFDRVVIDEAGQADEPSCLAPLTVAGRFVLCGDHLQLPPVTQTVVTSAGAVCNLEYSLFERLFHTTDESNISRLKTQYRMNTGIQEIPSRLFYNGSLRAAPEAARRKLGIGPNTALGENLQAVLDPEVPVVFVDVDGDRGGRARPEEARACAHIVGALLKCGLPADEIGVISPYRAQQSLIRDLLSSDRSDDSMPTVDTVDRFQGGEREAIILSLARSDEVTSFLADRRRLNVSLSRARSKLILLGHGRTLKEHPLFSDLLTLVEQVAGSAVHR